MTVTRLKRKILKKVLRAKNRIARVKRLTIMPVIKNIDVDAIRASFEKK